MAGSLGRQNRIRLYAVTYPLRFISRVNRETGFLRRRTRASVCNKTNVRREGSNPCPRRRPK